MIDPASIAAGVATGIAAEQSNRFIRELQEELSTDDFFGLFKEIRELLQVVAERLSPELTPNLPMPVTLEPWPVYWTVPEYSRAHLCMFLPSLTADNVAPFAPTITGANLYIEVPGAGRHIKAISPGWTQLDLPPGTQISSADASNYAVYFRFSDDPISDISISLGNVSIGAVTANAGTNLNTSALALEAGGNLTAIAADTSDLVTNTTGLATQSTLSAAKNDLDTIVTQTVGLATQATLAAAKTDLDTLAGAVGQYPAVGTALTPYGSNPSQTAAAGADTVYAFGASGDTPFKHVIVQNNRSIAINLAFDSVSTDADSQVYTIAVGQMLAMDRAGTELHFSSASQQAFSGPGGITIEAFA